MILLTIIFRPKWKYKEIITPNSYHNPLCKINSLIFSNVAFIKSQINTPSGRPILLISLDRYEKIDNLNLDPWLWELVTLVFCVCRRRGLSNKDLQRQNSAYYVATPEEFSKKFGGDRVINKVSVLLKCNTVSFGSVKHASCSLRIRSLVNWCANEPSSRKPSYGSSMTMSTRGLF